MKTHFFTILLSLTTLCGCTNNSTTRNQSSVDSDTVIAEFIEEDVIIENTIDKAKADSLSVYFRESKDEFSNYAWVYNKVTSRYRNTNDCYCYFRKDGDDVSNFRFVFQYEDDDWLFIKSLIFNIDGYNWTYIPDSRFDTDCGNGGRVWEWSDENIESEIDMIEKMSNAKTIKVKMIGRQYYDVRTLPNSQVKAIKQTYEYYKALGGTF